MGTDAATRKRTERARRKALGLVRVEIWIDPSQLARLRRYVEVLKRAAIAAENGHD
jgi:hypothetical protein